MREKRLPLNGFHVLSIASLAIGLYAAPSPAAVTLVSQERSVGIGTLSVPTPFGLGQGLTQGSGVSNPVLAPDFGPFDQILYFGDSRPPYVPAPGGPAVTQHSTLSPNLITGQGGSPGGALDLYLISIGNLYRNYVYSESKMRVVFDVDQPTPFERTGFSGVGSALDGPNGQHIDLSANGTTIDGLLSPGQWTLIAGDSAGDGRGSYNFSLSFVPEPSAALALGALAILASRRLQA